MTETKQNAFQKWWGTGFKANEYGVPQYHQLDTAAAMVLHSKYEDRIRAKVKQHAAKDLALSKYVDKFDVGVTYQPTPHGNIGTVDLLGYKGLGSFAQVTLSLNNPTNAYVPALSFAAAKKLQPRQEWQPNFVRARAENIQLDPSRPWSGHDREGLVAVEWDHGSWVHSTKLHRKEKKDTFSLMNNFMVGYRGFAAGAELETAALLGKTKDDIRDYGFSAQYNRKNAFVLTASTQKRLKKLSLSPVFYFGQRSELAVGATITGFTAAPFARAPQFTTGVQYSLPARTTDTTIRTKFESDKKTVSVAVENNDLAWVNVVGSVSTSLEPGVRATNGTTVGLSLVIGDNNKDTDHVSLMGFGATGGARCPYCK
jgi:hypothetical protein